MVPIGPCPSQAPSTSASPLWATASKEWVIPAKPKPGRKPKVDLLRSVTTKEDEDDQSCGKRVQNRAAQRAFRERKQSQLAELQARLHSYEQGEVKRNVALQNIAKKTKEENEQLRKENVMLKERIARLEEQLQLRLDQNKKRATEDDAGEMPADFPSAECPARKRVRVDEESIASYSSETPPTLEDGFQMPIPSPAYEGHSLPFPISPSSSMLAYAASNVPAATLESPSTIDSFQCMLCSPHAPCICGEVTLHQTAENPHAATSPVETDSAKLDPQPIFNSSDPPSSGCPLASVGMVNNSPAYQAPVPLRRRSGGSSANSVFTVSPLASSSSTPTVRCSGDPSNCMACADDSFGKAFCQAIGHTLASSVPCAECPRRTSGTDKILVASCCGDITKCGSCGIAPILSSAQSLRPRSPETIPTDDAWRQIKSHPNVAFADLELLAEVVARRSKCTRTRVVISPAPGSVTPQDCPVVSQQEENVQDGQSVPLTDLDEQFRNKLREHSSPPRLVPQDVLIACGRKRAQEVNADGVREALRLLDAKFAHSRP